MTKSKNNTLQPGLIQKPTQITLMGKISKPNMKSKELKRLEDTQSFKMGVKALDTFVSSTEVSRQRVTRSMVQKQKGDLGSNKIELSKKADQVEPEPAPLSKKRKASSQKAPSASRKRAKVLPVGTFKPSPSQPTTAFAATHNARKSAKKPTDNIKIKSFPCTICYENRALHEFVHNIPCGKHNICTECVTSSLSYSLAEELPVESFGCPGCGANWLPTFITGFLSPEDEKKYTKLIEKLSPKYRECQANNCDHGQIHERGLREPIVTCGKCSARSCFAHRVPWHESESCPQYADRIAEEEDDVTMKARLNREEAANSQMVKPCPKCRTAISKEAGCDAIYCKSYVALTFCYAIHAFPLSLHLTISI